MRKLFILVMSLCCIGLQAQEDNVQYQLMEGYAKNNIRNRIVVPDIPGYKTLKCDLHMHTIYSDGQVSPTQRVLEAWHEGLDAISITDHQPMPRYFMGTKDCNVSYDKAIGTAKSHHIILIKGVELWKTYKLDVTEVHALRGLNITVDKGEFVSIIGPSGSGKSTMMNIIGCLDVADEGEYILDGISID